MASALSQETQIGNPDAAQDLYGLGVRVGFYLQVLAMIFYSFGKREKYGRNLKLSSGSITLPILVSWLNYAANGQFSASEAVIVLLLLMNLSLPAKLTLLNPYTIIGEIVGLVIILSLELLTCAALLWTFATLVDTLPTLGTKHIVWFFTEISLRGAFRYVALAYCILDAITSLLFAYKVLRLINIAWQYYKANQIEPGDGQTEPGDGQTEPGDGQTEPGDGQTEPGDGQTEPGDGQTKPGDGQTKPGDGQTKPGDGIIGKIKDIIAWGDLTKEFEGLRLLIWIPITIIVELTIHYNHLSPSTDLRAPGQLIPLMGGSIVLFDSILVAARSISAKPGLKSFINGSIGYGNDLLQAIGDAIHAVLRYLHGFCQKSASSPTRSTENPAVNV